MTFFSHIVIDNFSQEEILTYSLILLKGHINQSFNGCQNPQKDTKTQSSISLEHYEYKNVLTVCENHFKFILDLKEGRNEISIKFCCETLNFNLNYVPRKTDCAVLPLYIICHGHDGCFQASENEDNSVESACKRILLIAKMLQCVTAEKLFEKTLSRRTFALEEKCQIFHSNLPFLEARKMDSEPLWQYMAREIMMSEIGMDNRKFLGFLSCTRYCGENYKESMKSHQDLLNITEAYIALGGGGLALFGSANLYTCAENFRDIIEKFEDKTLVNKNKFLDDSCYRGTLGACFSTYLGSVLHELCHTFDLGHSNSGIMARGFDNIYKVFTANFDDHHKIRDNFEKTIEFKESFEPKLLSEKLKNPPKDYQIVGSSRTERDVDDTFWTKSCATILKYHRWFNNYPKESKYVLKFEADSNVFVSTAGLRVVEIRRNSDELVVMDWTFDGKILKYSFQIPMDIKAVDDFKNIILFAEDNAGNILKLKHSLDGYI